MLNVTHSKWLPVSKSKPTANQGQNSQTTTSTIEVQTRVLPTTTTIRETDISTTNHHQNQNQNHQQFIQLRAPNLSRSGRTILVKKQRQQHQPQQQYREHRKQQQKPFFLRNYEILSQESLTQLMKQNQLLKQNLLLNQSQLQNQVRLLNQDQLLSQTQLLNQLNQRAKNRIQTIPRERVIQQSTQVEDQETSTAPTPVYSIISVPFLARSFLPTPSVEQKKSKTNGLVKTKPVSVNANAKNGQTIIICPEQEITSAHLNLLEQQQQKNCSNQLNTTVKGLNTKPVNLNTTRIPTTTTSTSKMGIPFRGNEFLDMNGALQIAAVEELMAPVCLDDYFIETNNNSDFDANKGTYKLHGLNEMTINQMNVDFADQLQPDDGQEEELMKEVPGEEQIYNIPRMQYSEELVSLTQPSIGYETLESESHFTQIDTTCKNNIEMIINSEDSDNSSSYIAISPGSPLPTESDCIATSELHNYKYMNDNLNIMQDDETSYRIEFSPESSHEHIPVLRGSSMKDEETQDIERILKQLVNESQQQSSNLKRNSDHLSNTQKKISGAKKSRLHIPITRLVMNGTCENSLATKVPDTPEVCEMVDEWLTDYNDTSVHSYSSSPSWSATSFAPPEFITDSFTLLEPKFENPPSITSSYICEEPTYATPSPSNSSYSTNPNSPAVSVYSRDSSRKPRGRPPKQHSDLPDPEVWRKLPETERKRYEDRCKNNEASRQSRQKNKEKQLSLLADEEREQRRNDELKNKMKTLDRQHRKLKKVLCRKWGNANSV